MNNYKSLLFCFVIFFTRLSYAYEENHFKTDVIGVSVAQLNSQYWINKLIDKDNIVMSLKQVTSPLSGCYIAFERSSAT